MPVLLVSVISKIIDALVQGGQMKADEAKAAQAALAQAQIQRDQTFSAFIQNTSNVLYTIMRNTIVGIFAASLVVPHWGQMVSQNAAGMPVYFWAIILWEFYGNAAMQMIPWVKNGNGGSAPVLPAPPVLPIPVDPASIKGGSDHTDGRG
jgi:hypothetical protein